MPPILRLPTLLRRLSASPSSLRNDPTPSRRPRLLPLPPRLDALPSLALASGLIPLCGLINPLSCSGALPVPLRDYLDPRPVFLLDSPSLSRSFSLLCPHPRPQPLIFPSLSPFARLIMSQSPSITDPLFWSIHKFLHEIYRADVEMSEENGWTLPILALFSAIFSNSRGSVSK